MHDQTSLKSTVNSRQSTVSRPSALAFGLLLLSFLALAAEPRVRPSPLAGEVDAKSFAQLVARQKGKVVLVNFWATWCEPCREEYPDLVRLQKELGPRGLQIVGVSTDFSSALPAAEKFLTQQKPGFPNYHKKGGGDDQDFIDAVDKNWGGELPFSVLYDRQGKKARTLSGKRTRAEYQREIVPLLR